MKFCKAFLILRPCGTNFEALNLQKDSTNNQEILISGSSLGLEAKVL